MNTSSEEELAAIEERAKTKVKHVVNFLWLVVGVFLLVGSFTPFKQEVAIGVVLFTVLWMFNQVIGRGIESTKVLFFSNPKKSDSNNSNKEQ